MTPQPHVVTVLASGSAAALTIGISAFAAVILIGIGIAINAIQNGRRDRASAAAVVVGVLTIAGLVLAILSSIV